MEATKTIFKILSVFEKQLDREEFDQELLDPKAWKITELRFYRYLQMLTDAGYITGLKVSPSPAGGFYITTTAPQITLKGIEYLAENSAMRKALEIIKTGAQIIK